jgi:hypothetical protein
MQIRARDINLEAQKYKRLVKKDRIFKEDLTTIKDIVLPLWEEVLSECQPDDYLFSHGFRPGAIHMSPDPIARTWKRQVKDKLRITADFYSLKHSNSDETDAIAGAAAAARQNAQTNEAMVVKIYATGRPDRMHEQLKKINNPFA